MANSRTDKLTPVLIIEDNTNHAENIVDVLPTDTYHCEHYCAADPQYIYKYLAQYPDAQIMIVDLLLRVRTDADPFKEGINLIREKLWPYNRTLFFVVFSEYISHKLDHKLGVFEPHWTFVKKEIEDGKLTQNCLDMLKNIIDACRNYAPPFVKQERFDSFAIVHEIQKYAGKHQAQSVAYNSAVERIGKSVDILNRLSDAAIPYLKAGRPTLRIAMGVYGSCGRLEKRPEKTEDDEKCYEKSDIDFCVFFDGGKELGSLALMLWNRMKFYMETEGWEFEGKEAVDGRTPNILGPEAVEDAFVLVNRYMPIINVQAVENANLKDDAHVRDRHFQILTELRPVFNGELIFKMKKQLIQNNVGSTILTISQLLMADYFGELVMQVFLDQKPNELKGFKNKKQYIYRIVGLGSLQLGLIGYALDDERGGLRHDSQWKELFEFLMLPGIGKIVRFATVWSNKYANNEDAIKILTNVENLADCYCRAISDLEKIPYDENDSTTEVVLTMACRKQFKEVTVLLGSVIGSLGAQQCCHVLKTCASWLFYIERYQDLMDGL